ncbi:hypothetical protein BDM02DRAFT_3124998, partial [Thelephora ganbajun]
MESGVGTGEVEDNRIVVAHPPAYGNTKESTLIEARGGWSSLATVASVESDKSRLVGYMTVDSEWDVRCNMSRAT